MIASLRGAVLSAQEGRLVLECGGVGYEVQVTAGTQAALPPGAEAFLLVVPSYGMYGGGETLYGFRTPAERSLFCALRDEVPGTGAKKALEYLERASKSLPDFRRAVAERDEKLLCAAFGFTRKTAAKLIEALKDKLGSLPAAGEARLRAAPDEPPAGPAWSQALAALAALGYRPAEARSALGAVAEEFGGAEAGAEALVRQALKRL